MLLIQSETAPARTCSRTSVLRTGSALLSAIALQVLPVPALSQQMPAPGTYGADDPDSDPQQALDNREQAQARSETDTADGGDNPVDTAERIGVQIDLPDGTPTDVAEKAAIGAPVATLTEAMRLAYWTSPALLAQRATVMSNDYRIPQARANYGPKLNYNLATVWQRDNLEQRSGPAVALSGWTTSASAVLTQPLFTFGRNASQERNAEAQIAFQRQVLRSTEQQALLDAISAYIGVLRDRASVMIAKDNLSALEQQLTDNKARLAVREVTATDVEQVSTRVSLGRAQVYSAQRDAATSEAAFVRLVGAPPGELVPPNPLQLPVRKIDEAYAYAELHSPIILAAQAREKVSRSSVAAAKADLMPRIDFQASASNGSQNPYDDSRRFGQLRGQVILSGPIFESGLRRARIGEAMAANDADWRLLDGALRENRATLASTWNDWQAQQATIGSLRDAEASARKAYEGAILQQRAGLITTLDVLDLARELLIARSNSNTAIANAYLAKARLLAAIGTLEQVWLMPNEARYNPDDHLDRVRRKGDIPIITPILRGVDTAAAIGGTQDRPVRDPNAMRTATPIVIQPYDTLAGPSRYGPATPSAVPPAAAMPTASPAP